MALVSQKFCQVHLSFIFEMILLANLNVNADHCILLFLDWGYFEVWREHFKTWRSWQNKFEGWHLLFVFCGTLTIRLCDHFHWCWKNKTFGIPVAYVFSVLFELQIFLSFSFFKKPSYKMLLHMPAWKGCVEEQGL